jgi:transglutaminase-like putative cysteine protease
VRSIEQTEWTERLVELAMNPELRGALATLSVWLTLAANAQAQRLPPDVIVSNPRVYDVTITTTFVVPRHGKNVSQLRVWHALPTSRPWDGLERTLGASAITYQPESGRVRHLASNESQHIFWEFREGLDAGKTFELVSRFRVRSVDRTFDYKQCAAKWSDYGVDYSPGHETRRQIDGALRAIVDEIKSGHPPAEAALEFCKWIARHITYDAAVPYGTGDLAAILNHKRGHCGHQTALFEAMCARAGIPTKAVVGMNLYAPGGVGLLHKIRADFENQHTWMKIYLPGSGWVEIDPGAGPKAFSFPSQVIENNTDFQNYVIWILEDGTWKQPDWEYRDGTWYSPYRIENRRTFRRVETQ